MLFLSAALAMEAALRGDSSAAENLSRRALDAFPRDAYIKPVFHYQVLWLLALAGAEDAFWANLETWWPDAWYAELVVSRRNPLLDKLWDDPRMEAAIAKGLARYPNPSGR